MADGPLLDDWYIRLSLSPPINASSGPLLVVRCNSEDEQRDWLSTDEFKANLSVDAMSGVIHALADAYLTSRLSAVRRVLTAFRRSGVLLS